MRTGGGPVLLGKRAYFSREHYEAHRGSAPAHLCELVVHCLELVSQLSYRDLEYRFKGGNSLLVLLQDPQRFSIDVDIVTVETKERLTEIVADIADRCDVFQRWEARAPKTKPWLPMISFKVFFESVYQPPEDAFVMLDCVLQPAPYGGEMRSVRCAAIYESDLQVEVPTVSGLVGDKLLTLGPATLGIPLGRGKEAHRLKPVFDVAMLARQGYDVALVRESISGCMDQENRIQGQAHGFLEVADDTRKFLEAPLDHTRCPDLADVQEGTYLYEIAKGFDGFREHLFRVRYTWDLLRADCRAILAVMDDVGTDW
jgi:hypothetical protein